MLVRSTFRRSHLLSYLGCRRLRGSFQRYVYNSSVTRQETSRLMRQRQKDWNSACCNVSIPDMHNELQNFQAYSD